MAQTMTITARAEEDQADMMLPAYLVGRPWSMHPHFIASEDPFG